MSANVEKVLKLLQGQLGTALLMVFMEMRRSELRCWVEDPEWNDGPAHFHCVDVGGSWVDSGVPGNETETFFGFSIMQIFRRKCAEEIVEPYAVESDFQFVYAASA